MYIASDVMGIHYVYVRYQSGTFPWCLIRHSQHNSQGDNVIRLKSFRKCFWGDCAYFSFDFVGLAWDILILDWWTELLPFSHI